MTKLNWVHYSESDKPIALVSRDTQEPGYKPFGFWITPENVYGNWHDWCTEESFRLHSLKYIHEVTFKPNANLLVINNSIQLDDFTQDYAIEGDLSKLSGSFRSWREGNDTIDWERISQKYQGILIPYYISERRLFSTPRAGWYYPWDCGSGCIWDVSCIENIKVRERTGENVTN